MMRFFSTSIGLLWLLFLNGTAFASDYFYNQVPSQRNNTSSLSISYNLDKTHYSNTVPYTLSKVEWMVNQTPTNYSAFTPMGSSTSASGPLSASINGANGQVWYWHIQATYLSAKSASLLFLMDSAGTSLIVDPKLTSPSAVTAVVGKPFSYQIMTDQTVLSYSASGLPYGLTFDSQAGTISGNPLPIGYATKDFSIPLSFGLGSATLIITVQSNMPVITSSATLSVQAGQQFTYAITGTNTPTSYGATPIPAWMSFDPATGILTGSSLTPTSTQITVTATNYDGIGALLLSITVNPPAPFITSQLAAAAQADSAFTYAITATNSPTSFAAQGLPSGLSIDATKGDISGTPVVAGSFDVVISAINSGGTGSATLNITIATSVRLQVNAFVTGFYQNCLNRAPDAAGLSSWTTSLMSKAKSGSDVARGFALSQEFLNRNLTDSAFLDVLYQAFFNRAADPGGKAGWQTQLSAGVLREDVLYGFIQAQEFNNLCGTYNITPIDSLGTQQFQVRQFVRRFYQQCLGREPDAAGIANWTQGLLNGSLTGRDVARGFALSQEFANKGTNNSVFLDTLYKSFFDRAADDGGKAAWTGLLTSGGTRSTVLDGFVGAQEFVNLCNRYGILPFPPNG